MRKILTLFCLLLSCSISAGGSGSFALNILDRKALDREFKIQVNADMSAKYVYQMTDKMPFDVELEGISKGNGTLKIANLLLRIYDEHEDQYTYQQRLLTFSKADLGLFLFITGVLQEWDDKGDSVIEYSPISVVLQYNCESRQFDVLFQNSKTPIIMSRSKAHGPMCAGL